MAVSIVIDVTVNSQSIENNTSNVTVKVNAKWTYGSYNKLEKSGWLTIDGTKYTFTSPFNTGQSTSGSCNLFTKTVNVSHNDNGSKTLACSASYTSGVSSGTVAASTSVVLATIPRKSSLSASNGTLNTAQTLTVTRKSNSFTHTITYKCGSASGTICTKSSSTSISWTPPLSLASQNTTGTSVSVTFTITTYNGSTSIGSNTKTISCAIPSSVKPSCSVAVEDSTGYSSKYGGYIKGFSKFKVTVTPTTSYGSAIATYKTTANGSTYSAASFTTGVLKSSGSLTVNATVTDKRGRSGSASKSLTVLNYTAPAVNALSVHRCDSEGLENIQGEYIGITFSGAVTPLNNANTATYTIKYKKSSESEYTTVTLSDLQNVYSVNDFDYIFEADTGSSYNVIVTAADDFTSDSKTAKVSSAFALMHWKSNGRGMGIGKLAELDDTLDVGFLTKFSGGIVNEVLEKITDLNDVMIPNIYVSVNKGATSYTNCPIESGTFVLEVMNAGAEGQVFQRLTSTFKGTHQRFERHYYQGAWGDWVLVHSDSGWVDLTLQDGISVGSECGFLKGRLKNNVLHIQGDVKGIAANWKYFAHIPAAIIPSGLASSNRITAVYNMSYFCGLNLMSNGQLYVSSNSAGTWDSSKNTSVNVTICGD